MAMRKDIFLLIIGLLVFVTPFLGVPESWKDVMLFVYGFFIVIMAMAYRLNFRKNDINDEDIAYEESVPKDYNDVLEV